VTTPLRSTHAEHAATTSAGLMTVGQIAALLACSVRTVYRLSDEGRMPRPLKLSGMVRWRNSEIGELM
jgi:predicted DNA-binding transcriptional regulator AlpA